jgi:forespore regulator of the sigma-K checkpoint
LSAMTLWKQLKKRLRTRRRWLALGIFVLAAAVAGVAAAAGSVPDKAQSRGGGTAQSALAPIVRDGDAKKQADALEAIKRDGMEREVVLLKSYVCGEERQKLGRLKPIEIQNMHAGHPDWKVRLAEDGSVVFTRSIEDLSPACKETAFFGIDENGNLTLFDGVPGKDNVIRTFFQLNIRHLESSLPRDTVNQLYSGIRVSDLAEYNSVLSTFSDYAVEETQKAMKAQPNER